MEFVVEFKVEMNISQDSFCKYSCAPNLCYKLWNGK